MSTVLCRDCRHVRNPTEAPTWWQCALTKKQSLTDGGDYYENCAIVRATPSLCGPEGKWHEPHADAVDHEPPDQYNRPADQESQL